MAKFSLNLFILVVLATYAIAAPQIFPEDIGDHDVHHIGTGVRSFELHTNKVDYFRAEASCQFNNYELAIIHSKEELQIIQDEMKKKGVEHAWTKGRGAEDKCEYFWDVDSEDTLMKDLLVESATSCVSGRFLKKMGLRINAAKELLQGQQLTYKMAYLCERKGPTPNA